MHLSWNLLLHNTEWSQMFKCRYFKLGKPKSNYFSSVWYGIKLHILTVMENSLWLVGSGDEINFWNDNWIGTPLVDLLNISPAVRPLLSSTVSDAIVDGQWVLPHPVLHDAAVVSRISHVTLPTSPLPDKLVWIHARDGALSAKIAFQFLNPVPPAISRETNIWRSCIPPSHSFIFWHLKHRKMPSDENLRLRGCTIVSVCVLCLGAAEYASHLFLSCPFAVDLWRWLGEQLHRQFDLPSIELLLEVIPARISSQALDIFVSSIVHTLHAIWIARNGIRFNNARVAAHGAKATIISQVSMSGSESKGYCLSSLSDTGILDAFQVHPRHCRVKDIIPVVWQPPAPTWMKVNTDGSVLGNHASCGGIFHDHRGTFVGCFSSNLGSFSVFESELLGFIHAMEIAFSVG